MKTRERFQHIVNFRSPDRGLVVEWAPWWTETLDAWAKQGFEPAPRPAVRADPVLLQQYFGLDRMVQEWVRPLSPDCPSPTVHGGGRIRNRDEYRELVRRKMLYPDVDNLELRHFAKYSGRDGRDEAIFWLTFDGFFWHPRTLFGIEEHLFAFFDQPELILEMNQRAVDYYLRVLERVLPAFEIDFMTFAEDLSYNHGTMISRDQFEQFIAPFYAQLIPVMKARGIKIFIDSDGDVSECAGWFLDAGVDGILPLERAAGVDVGQLRQRYPRLLMLGGFDKMVMHRGEEKIRGEFERLLPLWRSGGFIPSCDHQTPPAVSPDDYRLYLKLFAEYAAKAAERE